LGEKNISQVIQFFIFEAETIYVKIHLIFETKFIK